MVHYKGQWGDIAMPKKKCPACGSTETVKILYGMPSYEAFELVERGETVLGGCCVSDNDPTRHCKTCGQDFGVNETFSMLGMTSLEFYVGGYFGESYFVYINGKRKSKLIRYAKTPGGMAADLKHPKNEINFHPDILLKEVPLPPEQWITFTEEIAALDVSCWRDSYYENNICDGTQWHLIIKFPNREKISKNGSNDYPPYWNGLIKIMKKYIGEDIG
ncbi:hypothetical protein SAMN03080606_01112 [Alkaliphilus peptidifermentans DSM 18978]|uniref:Uncharacterized protein n=2 Tax=Alkaliphilus TaxID=114627 RepID=A0A1G5EDA3_9FIRM|nr:hypothetical protein SAMN03080606_01112 [Alkaliphilus peptidifermentans DSM 18978]